MLSRQIGKQEPRIKITPKLANWENLYSDGEDAATFAGAYGLTPDKWQLQILIDWLKRDDEDRFAATSCGLSVPRQNGKNALLEMRELYGLCIIGEKILHTAHRVDTARKAFLRLVSFFENIAYPELRDIVLLIRRANGQETIILKNGGSIEFSSRVNGGARGSTYDAVVFDEAQELNDDQMEAIMSTMSAAPLRNRQQLFVGTPPSPVSSGTVFRRKRKAAISGEDKNIIWYEWSVDEIGDITDKARWYETNPALGIRLDESFTETECKTLTIDGFARERLGWWSEETGANAVFKKSAWLACKTDKPPEQTKEDKIAYGVKFAPDGAHVALGVAVKSPDGRILVECLDYSLILNGINRLAKWLIERKDTCSIVVIDGKSNTAALAKKLLDGGFARKGVLIAGSNDVCAAASMFFNAVNEKEICHINQPTLEDSVLAAQRRTIGNNGGWGFDDGIAPCTPVESVALAYWGVLTTKRNPQREARIL